MDEFERLTLNGELRFSIMASVTRCVQRGVSKKRTVYWRKHELIKNKYILRTYFKRTIRFQLLYYLPRDLPRVVVNMREEIIKSMSNVIFHTLQRYRAIWEFLIIWSWYLIISTFSEESWLIIWIFCTPSFPLIMTNHIFMLTILLLLPLNFNQIANFLLPALTLTGHRQTISLWYFCTKMRLDVF